jgi:hypothetical protein
MAPRELRLLRLVNWAWFQSGRAPTYCLALCAHQTALSKTSAARRILAMMSTSNGHRSRHTSHSMHSDALTGRAAYNSRLNCSDQRVPL